MRKAVTCFLVAFSVVLFSSPAPCLADATWKELVNNSEQMNQNGSWSNALAYAKSALVRSEMVYGRRSLNTAKTHLLLAELYSEKGKFSSAEMHYAKAIGLLEDLFHKGHPSTIRPITGLAELCVVRGHSERAESLYRAAIASCNNSGILEPGSEAALVGLAGLYGKQAKYEEAKTLLQDATAVMDRSAKYDRSLDSLRVRAYSDMGEIFSREGKYSEAVNAFENALSAVGNGPNFWLKPTILSKLSECHSKCGSYNLAKDAQKQALVSNSKIRGATVLMTLQP
jgi:tetratricopeptide (TPR) repeat protein